MRVLIVKTSALGDVVQTFPVAAYLRSRPEIKEIGWVVEKKAFPLVSACPFVDHVIEIDTVHLKSLFPSFHIIREFQRQRSAIRENSWDLLFDLQGNCKSGMVTFLASAKKKIGYGNRSVAERPNLLTTSVHINPPRGMRMCEEYLQFVQTYFQDHEPFAVPPMQLKLTALQETQLAEERARWPNHRPVWILALGSYWPNKRYPSDKLLSVLELVQRMWSPYFIFLAANSLELKEAGWLAKHFVDSSHIVFQQKLSILQRMLGAAHAVVAVDSLILHLAATTETPIFSIFGPSNSKNYAPKGSRHGVFQGKCHFFSQEEKRCRELRTCDHGSCLNDVDSLDLFAAIQDWQQRI